LNTRVLRVYQDGSVPDFLGIKVKRNQDFEVSWNQGFKVPVFKESKILKFLCFRASRFK
jgi:hypothetical protein